MADPTVEYHTYIWKNVLELGVSFAEAPALLSSRQRPFSEAYFCS